MADPTVVITSARVETPAGVTAATLDLVDVGGGSQVVTVDGTPEERVHPSSRVFHVRLISPDRMLPDQLHETSGYEEAVELAVRYAERLAEHADRIAGLAEDLKV